jgi:hypothetical protein
MTVSTSLRRCIAALGFCTLVVLPAAAFAVEDAGSAPEDATATVADAGSSDIQFTPDIEPAIDVTATADISVPVDVMTPDTTPADTTPGSFNVNPCWDEKCAKETAACKASANCVKIHDCGGDPKCIDPIVKADKAAGDLFFAISDCGYKACNDPTKGSCKDKCGKFLGDTAPCNCDDACKDPKYGDCCADIDIVCATANSCEGKCGKYDKAATCQCDDQCDANGDCCDDIADKCPTTPAGDAGTSTGKDAGGSCTCANKECGDDGCGHPCGANKGACASGASCSSAGKCLTGATTDTAGGTGDAGSVKDSAGTGAVVPPAASNSSSGCTAGSTGSRGMGLLLVIGALIGVLAFRRRFA